MAESVDEEVIIPITEWPVISPGSAGSFNPSENDKLKTGHDNRVVASISDYKSRIKNLKKQQRFRPYDEFSAYSNEQVKVSNVNSSNGDSDSPVAFRVRGNASQKDSNAAVTDSNDNGVIQADISSYKHNSKLDGQKRQVSCDRGSIDVKIARWWRRHKTIDPSNGEMIQTGNANTSLYHISRSPECRKFLQMEKANLLKSSSSLQAKPTAHVYADLAGIEDRLGNLIVALDYINKSVLLQPDEPSFLWLKAKLTKQCDVFEKQQQALLSLPDIEERKFPSFSEVHRISGKLLSVDQFQSEYVKKGKPVILTDVVRDMTTVPFDFSFVKTKAGHRKVTVKQSIQDSVEWARLEEGSTKSVGQFIDEVESGQTDEYLFDWSLPIHCPDLAESIILPGFFKDNFLLKTTPGSLYQDSWPSLFVAPQGTISNLHVDAFASHFWMALFQGEKRWIFFDEGDVPYLYPRYFHSMDPTFDVNVTRPDTAKHPLVSLSHPKSCILKPGELLFVPAGCPHYVENLTSSLAISSNYVNDSNFEKVCQELAINALQDPRAKDLLEQFKSDPCFNSQDR